MTIEQLREKIAYRTNKMNWCISVGRETQAEWNRDQIARLEESIRVMEQDAAMQVVNQANVRNRPRPASNTDEDFDYV